MDYYSYEGGKWSNYFKDNELRKQRLALRKQQKGVLGGPKICYEAE